MYEQNKYNQQQLHNYFAPLCMCPTRQFVFMSNAICDCFGRDLRFVNRSWSDVHDLAEDRACCEAL